MHDLASIRDSGEFSRDVSALTRIAFVHRSFRSVSVRRNLERSLFSSHFPALGLLSLAHSLRTDAARRLVILPELRYFDEEAFESEDALAAQMKAWLEPGRRRLIAASSYTTTIDRLEEFLARFEASRYLILVGGAHATTAPEIQCSHIVVRGEGGAALRHVLHRLFSDDFGQGDAARGLNYIMRGRKVTSVPAFDRSIEALPSPGFAYDLLPRDSELSQVYATNFKRMLGRKPMIYICTQSCRARCTFCSTYLIHGKTVARPINKVEDDLHYLVQDCGYDSIEFHDDDLLQHPDFINLLQVIQHLNVPWFCYGRAEAITPAIATAMAAAGCRRVFLGIEAMDQPTLDYFNKHTTVEQNRAAVDALARAGVGVLAGFIIGAPHHTIESILDELDTFLAMPLLGVYVSILSPDPGTLEFHRARKLNPDFEHVSRGRNATLRLIPDTARFGTQVPIGLPSVCRHVSKKDLNDLVKLIEMEFYLRPQISARLREGMHPDQADIVDAFLAFQERQKAELGAHGGAGNLHPKIQRRVDALLKAGVLERDHFSHAS